MAKSRQAQHGGEFLHAFTFRENEYFTGFINVDGECGMITTTRNSIRKFLIKMNAVNFMVSSPTFYSINIMLIYELTNKIIQAIFTS
jgi:hypothetical protein